MNSRRSTKDGHGNDVRVGDVVRIVSLSKSFLASLPPDEIKDVSSMIGETFTVEEIDDQGSAWISKCWSSGEGQENSHSLGLAETEMELVGARNAN